MRGLWRGLGMSRLMLPAGYRRVNYIQNDATRGEAYINTGVITSPANTFFADVQLVDVDENSQTVWGGRMTASSPGMGNQFSFTKSSGRVQFCVGSYVTGRAYDTRRHAWLSVHEGDFRRLYMDGALCAELAQGGFMGEVDVYLFATNNNGVPAFAGGSLKLWGCKIWTEGALVRSFVPCVRTSDGAAGLYDLVGGGFYAAQGEGGFTAG